MINEEYVNKRYLETEVKLVMVWLLITDQEVNKNFSREKTMNFIKILNVKPKQIHK